MEQKKENTNFNHLFDKFLKKKGLNIYEYNKLCEENKNEEIEKISNFLKLAKTKSDLKYLIAARNIVHQAEDKAKENDPEFNLDDDVEEAYILEVFNKIRPDAKYIKSIYSEYTHRGDYYSQNVYFMMTRPDPFYIMCHEYFEMNILDNNEEIFELNATSKAWKGYSLADIIIHGHG